MAVVTSAVPKPLHSHRALIGWMSDQEQITLLLGRPPMQTDDLEALAEIKASYQKAVASRPSFTPSDPFTEVSDQKLRDILAARPDIQMYAQQLHGRVVMVDLKQVLAFQSLISIEGWEERITPTLTDPQQLVDLCFPPNASSEISCFADDAGGTVVSANPNLLMGPGQWQRDPVTGMPLLVFPMRLRPNFLMVSSYQGRHFQSEGYHRSATLLHAGLEHVPCIHVKGQSLEQIGWRNGMLTPDHFLSDHPPFLKDFWDETVAAPVFKQTMMRVYRAIVNTFEIAV